MRGKLKPCDIVQVVRRITPADAGKTFLKVSVGTFVKDHPRGCGENVNRVLEKFENIGSPPRMRGKQKQKWKKETHTGITPADAGKTRFFSNFTSPLKDHPRGCGENGVR